MDEVYISSQLDSVFVRQEFHLTKYVLIFVDVHFVRSLWTHASMKCILVQHVEPPIVHPRLYEIIVHSLSSMCLALTLRA